MARPNLLTYKGNGTLQYVNNSEFNAIAEVVLERFASIDGPGNIYDSDGGVSYTTIGTFTDTRYQGNAGSGDITILSTTTTLYQDLTSNYGTVTNSPIYWDSTGNNIKLSNNLELNNIADEIVSYLVTNDGPGTYTLATSAPAGGTWVSIASIDNINDVTTTTYNIYKKISGEIPLTQSPLKIQGSSLKIMSQAEIEQLVEKVRERIVTNNIGQYAFQPAVPSVGTWQNKGTVIDSRPTISPQNYDGLTYAGLVSYVGTTPVDYIGDYLGTTPATYTGITPEDYLGTTPAVFSSNFSGTFTGFVPANYLGTTPANYFGTTSTNYGGTYVGNYVGTGQVSYIGITPENYLGTIPASYGGNYIGDYVGSQPVNYTGTTNVTYTGPTLALYTGTYFGNYVGSYTGTTPATYTGPASCTNPSVVTYSRGTYRPNSALLYGDGGTTYPLSEILSTSDSTGDTVRGWYSSDLGRNPDKGGFDFWYNQIIQNGGVDFPLRQAFADGAQTEINRGGSSWLTYCEYLDFITGAPEQSYFGTTNVTYTGTYFGSFTGSYVGAANTPVNYVSTTPATYTGSFGVLYFGDYTGFYLGTTPVSYTGTTPASYIGTAPVSYFGNYVGSYTGTTPATYTGLTPATYTGTTAVNYTGTYTGNFTGTIPATYTGTTPANYTGLTPANYTGIYTGVVPATYASDVNYLSTYLGSIINNDSTTISTTTLWRRIA